MGKNFKAYPVTALLLFPNVRRLALGNFIWDWHISFSLKVGSSCKAGSAGVRGLDGGGAGGDGCGGCGLGGGGVSSRLRFRLNLFLGTEEAMGGVVRLNRKEIKTSNRSMPLQIRYICFIILMNCSKTMNLAQKMMKFII